MKHVAVLVAVALCAAVAIRGNGADVTADSVYFVGAKPIPGVYPVIAPG